MHLRLLLLRGINVGGHNRLTMNELAATLNNVGCANVKWYIQSGNVAFSHKQNDPVKLKACITAAISKAHKLTPEMMLMEPSDLTAAIAGNPFPQAQDAPKSLHLFFAAAPLPTDCHDRLTTLLMAEERYQIQGKCLYLHAPNGIGRSK